MDCERINPGKDTNILTKWGLCKKNKILDADTETPQHIDYTGEHREIQHIWGKTDSSSLTKCGINKESQNRKVDKNKLILFFSGKLALITCSRSRD